jgi:endonuclease-3
MPGMDVLLRRLKKYYPDAECALRHAGAFQLLAATILSAQCTDERVNKVTPVLFKRYPTPAALARARVEDVEEVIRSTGFFRQKAKSLVMAARRLVEEFGGRVPRAMKDLLSLRGVARKTASVVLGVAYGLAEGVVVDTHVRRLSRRLGWTRHEDPVKIERDLMRRVPQKEWIWVSHALITHGRGLCRAVNPQCPRCFLRDRCPYPMTKK